MTQRIWVWGQSQLAAANEAGASLVEYALLVALIAVAAIAAVTLIGTNVSTTLNDVATTLP